MRLRVRRSKRAERAAWDATPWEALAARIAPLHDHLIELLAPHPGERWLDLATGTGAVAIRAARAGADVVGADLSPEMVRTASRLAEEEGHGIRFDVADAERLPYPDGSFDVVASALGVEAPADHAAVARELARVCRTGGRVGLAVWRPDPLWDAVRGPVQQTRRRPDEDWGRDEYATRLLGGAFALSFAEGEVRLRAESGEAAWAQAVAPDGPLADAARSLPPRALAELRGRYVAYYERFRGPEGVDVPKPYVVVLGRRLER